jgi:hypothetical protein
MVSAVIVLRARAAMIKACLAPLLCAPLLGCDSLHAPLINMTDRPIVVEYSCCGLPDARKSTVPPKRALWLFGGPPFARLHLNSLTVSTPEGNTYRYNRADLMKLRPRHTLEDRFGWYGYGLRYLRRSPTMKRGPGGSVITATYSSSDPERPTGEVDASDILAVGHDTYRILVPISKIPLMGRPQLVFKNGAAFPMPNFGPVRARVSRLAREYCTRMNETMVTVGHGTDPGSGVDLTFRCNSIRSD